MNQESKTQEPNYPKPKNPKRVAAGKKGAEARWKKKQQVDQAPQEVPQVTKVVREPQEIEPTLKVNVYKKYLPLCVVLVFGIGIFMLYNKPVPATQVIQPPQQPKPVIDPFEMN